jgi:hypothetical protein
MHASLLNEKSALPRTDLSISIVYPIYSSMVFHISSGYRLEAGSQADERLLQTLRESGRAIVNAQNEWVRR